MAPLLDPIRDAIERHCASPHQATPIPGLTIFRMTSTTPPDRALYNPRLLLIVQGAKSVALGELSFRATPANFLLVTVNIPVTTQIEVTPDGRPHLALTLSLDRALLAEVLQRVAAEPVATASPAALAAAPLTDALLEPFSRLLRLLDHPDEIDFMAPLIVREIYYRLLTGALGETLTQFALNSSHVAKIGRVTDWIKHHYAEPMSIEVLAELAGMSVTSFHRHFKNLTSMTPIQYRMQIRLREARRMLISEGEGAGAIGLKVGYESQSQFSRDYKRLFGAPPASDTARLANGR
ncbi:AraC family transcriptional regulator [Burkholderia gladioli]|uniref:AraC family transcriptional regulator n=1 Tax=Burkholderia gladioli TaxID=28095 RepID=UPI0016409060|nr:AraC family transcriptional regulator [Burkholderia gladioli]MDA0572514.1 AraC family transcriptional regulator [Burkholderia gladioli]MDA0600866.1 AraC family transcriptional regulator [Burkholderia gladioli]